MRPEFSFDFTFWNTRTGRDHTVAVDVMSLLDGEFVLRLVWSATRHSEPRLRRLPEKLARVIRREQDVSDRAFDAFRDVIASERLNAEGL